MSDDWEEDGKARELVIPGIALPGLRDLRVQFVALIVFDTFMGPIVYLNEIERGSSYIKKLREYQTISEVYAGTARADVDVISTKEDEIVVFRYHPEGNIDITTVFMISCMPDTDLAPLRTIGSRALFRSKGDPETIGKELSVSLREYQTRNEEFRRLNSEVSLKIIKEDQIRKPLPNSFIKGLALIDIESRLADFRIIPQWYDGREIMPADLLVFLDNLYESVVHDKVTGVIYQSIPMILSKVKDKEIYFVLMVSESHLQDFLRVGNWLNAVNDILAKEWKYATLSEIKNTIAILNEAPKNHSPPDYLRSYIQMSIQSDKIRPVISNPELLEIQPNENISPELWSLLSEMDGNKSILRLSTKANKDIFQLIRFLEWSHSRKLLAYLKEKK